MVTSSQPRKQRKYRYNAPLHIKSKFMTANLSEDLKKKYSKRSARVIVGDVVKIMRGDHAGTEGKVREVDVKREHVTVEGVSVAKADGKEEARPIHPSNLMITKLNLEDEKRVASLERK
ncbi:50S ribosomal protein L24 [Methanocella sp. CWC-04]|uniref:Large ribosomal subunit protein uL24 n=1 Tax=Methanooceanicella nereidis TaxID=2052831 RepID=A0AAP2W4Q2_9EURY|nr:50S ribosomal protein L24 [Methanocella sp. CWC-04]MCD1293502.1 50S ribosomal protein L24 [Methanocella sp. CWC-04]